MIFVARFECILIAIERLFILIIATNNRRSTVFGWPFLLPTPRATDLLRQGLTDFRIFSVADVQTFIALSSRIFSTPLRHAFGRSP